MEPAARPRPDRGRLAAATVFAVYLVLAVVYFARAWTDPLRTTISTGLDGADTLWFMRWVPYAVTHGRNPLVTTFMYYPRGVNVMWNNADAIPLVGLLTTPVQGLVPTILLFNIFATLAFAASAWTAYLAIRRHVQGEIAAALGGLAYGFGSYMTAQGTAHMGLTLAFIPPLMLISLESILVRQRRGALRDGVLLGLLAAIQLVLTEEMLASEVVAGGVFVVVLAMFFPSRIRNRLPYAAQALAIAAVVALVISAYPLATAFFGPGRVVGAIRDIQTWSTDLANFVEPTSVQWLHSFGMQANGYTTNVEESDAYLGLPLLLVMAIIVAVRHRRADVRVAAASGVALAVLSMGPQIHLHGQLIGVHGAWPFRRTPVLQNLLPARLMLFADLAAGWLLAVFVQHLAQLRRPWRPAGWTVVAAVILTLCPSWPAPTQKHTVPPFISQQAARELHGQVALVFPAPLGVDIQSPAALDTILWQVDSGMAFRVANNSALVQPPQDFPDLVAPMVAIQDGQLPDPGLSRGQLVADLQQRHVEVVLLGPMAEQHAARSYLDSLLGPGSERGGVIVWRVP